MKWQIDKSFSFCYGHRVHNQTLNADYTGSDGTCLACRHIHGHEGLVKMHLASDKLERGMVVDFKMTGWFKDFLDDVLDHKFIMDINDPLFSEEVSRVCTDDKFDPSKCIHHSFGNYWTPDLTLLSGLKSALYEKYEGMVFVDFVPTSENLAAWLLKIAREKMSDIGVDVVAMDYWETPKSHCRVEV